MTIMFISDIHGSKNNLKLVRDIYDKENADMIIILGDVFYGGNPSKEVEDLINSFPNKVVIKGNNDFSTDIFRESIEFVDSYTFSSFGKIFFCSHGDVYNVMKLPNKSFDVMVFGHTHAGRIFKDGTKYFINPGSISYPRAGTENSYIIVDSKGIYLKNLYQVVLDKILW